NLNRTILARHSKRRGGSRQSSALRLNGSKHHRVVSRKHLVGRRNLMKNSQRASFKIARTRAGSARPHIGQLPHAAPIALSGLYSAVEVQNRIRELIKLAKEQGYLTF